MSSDVWKSEPQHTVLELMAARLEADPDGPYLDVCGTALTAAQVQRTAASLARALVELGVRARRPGGDADRELARGHAGLVGDHHRRRRRRAGQHRLQGRLPAPPARPTPGPRCSSSRPRWPIGPAAWCDARPGPTLVDHVVVVGDDRPRAMPPAPTVHDWDEVLADRSDRAVGRRAPGRPGHLHLHRRHHRPVEGLHAEPPLPRRAGQPDRRSAGGAPPTTWCGRRCRCSTSTPSPPRWSGRWCTAGGPPSTAASRSRTSGRR